LDAGTDARIRRRCAPGVAGRYVTGSVSLALLRSAAVCINHRDALTYRSSSIASAIYWTLTRSATSGVRQRHAVAVQDGTSSELLTLVSAFGIDPLRIACGRMPSHFIRASRPRLRLSGRCDRSATRHKGEPEPQCHKATFHCDPLVGAVRHGRPKLVRVQRSTGLGRGRKRCGGNSPCGSAWASSSIKDMQAVWLTYRR
jgi:hypothetical protein